MDQNTLLTIFVAISAIALLMQFVMLLGLFLIARRLQQKIMPMIPQVEAIIASTRRTVDVVSVHIENIGTTSKHILDVTKEQLQKNDEIQRDAKNLVNVQIERAEMLI
jgi:hypothetical protein